MTLYLETLTDFLGSTVPIVNGAPDINTALDGKVKEFLSGDNPPTNDIDFARAYALSFLPLPEKRSAEQNRLVDWIDAIHAYAHERAVDPLTGGLKKNHSETTIALAHRRARNHNKPTGFMLLDFSNMGGTNLYFRKMLAAVRGVCAEDVPEREAEALTDRVARAMIDRIRILVHDKPGIDPVILRSGGDEVTILIPGFENKNRSYRDLLDTVHNEMDEMMAHLELRDHPYAKTGKDDTEKRKGFGLGAAMCDLRDVQFSHQLAALDDEISKTKKQRAELYSPDNVLVSLHNALKAGGELPDQFARAAEDDPGPSLTRRMEIFEESIKAMERENKEALARLDQDYRSARPVLRAGAAACLEILQEELPKVPETTRFDDIVGAHAPGFEPNSTEANVVCFMKARLLQKDPVTGTWTRDILDGLRTHYQTLAGAPQDGIVTFCISLHGVAALNNFGHEAANIVMKVAVENIRTVLRDTYELTESLDYELAHLGGGEFFILMKPAVQAKVEPGDINHSMSEIGAALQKLSCKDLFGKTLDDKKKSSLPDTLADLPDSKKKRNLIGVHIFSNHAVLQPGDQMDGVITILSKIASDQREDMAKNLPEMPYGVPQPA